MGKGYKATRKHRDENKTGKKKTPIYHVMQNRQSAFRDTPDQPDKPVNQD